MILFQCNITNKFFVEIDTCQDIVAPFIIEMTLIPTCKIYYILPDWEYCGNKIIFTVTALQLIDLPIAEYNIIIRDDLSYILTDKIKIKCDC